MSERILDISDLRVTFELEGFQALRGVDLHVGVGEKVGLVGESGSGKSTVALSVLRLHDEAVTSYGPDSRVEVAGTELLGLSPDRLRAVRGAQVSMVFQDPLASLNPVFTIGRQIQDVVRTHNKKIERGELKRRVHGALRDAGISEPERIARSYPFQLSGGLRQRAMIAMAIACGPRLLIADEPTSALDATVQAEVLNTFRRIGAEHGMSLLLISHDIGVVATLCDRVYVMLGGEVVESGPSAQVILRPQHEYTRRLIASARYRESGRLGDTDAPGATVDRART